MEHLSQMAIVDPVIVSVIGLMTLMMREPSNIWLSVSSHTKYVFLDHFNANYGAFDTERTHDQGQVVVRTNIKMKIVCLQIVDSPDLRKTDNDLDRSQ